MADLSISEAIALFDHSQTARGGNGPVGKWPLRVIEALRYVYDIDEAGLATPELKSKNGIIRGEWAAWRKGLDLRINPSYLDSLPAKERLPIASLILVHEGLHASSLDFQRLYDEVAARKLTVYYYRELSGPGVVNVLTGERVWIGNSKTFDVYKAMSRYLDKDQLVDYVLSIEIYTDRSYIDKDWIVNNFDNWGGMKNRWRKTKRLYVKILLPAASDTYYAARIVGILESIETKEEWEKMVAAVKEMSRGGSLRTLQVSFDSLLGDRNLASRIGQLERRWSLALTERP
jgi:hypothetical protein